MDDLDSYSNTLDMYSSGGSQEMPAGPVCCTSCNKTFRSSDRGVSSSMCSQCAMDAAAAFLDEFDDDKTETAEDACDSSYALQTNKKTDAKKGRSNTRGHQFLDDFMTTEASFSIEYSGRSHCYARKKFQMDGATLRLFVNPEVMASIPPLFNYYVLGAHFNTSTKIIHLSMVRTRNYKTGKEYVILCYLRTKSARPRYDVVLWDVDSEVVILWTGISKHVLELDYLLDEEVDSDQMGVHLVKFLTPLFWDSKNGPNKDEQGHLIVDGFDPIVEGQLAATNEKVRKRRNPKRNTKHEPLVSTLIAVHNDKKCRGKAKAKRAAATRASKQGAVKNDQKKVKNESVVEDGGTDNDLPTSKKSKIPLKKDLVRMLEEQKRKYELLEDQLLQRSASSSTPSTPVPTPQVVGTPSQQFTGGYPPVTPTYTPHMQPTAQQMTLGPCSSTLSSPLQYMQAQALLNQGKRTSRWNEAELQVQTYEAFILSMQPQQHVVTPPMQPPNYPLQYPPQYQPM